MWCDDAGLISFVRVSYHNHRTWLLDSPDCPAFLDRSRVLNIVFIDTGEVVDKTEDPGEDRVNILARHGKI